jgi:Transglutaminase-like superfamily
MPVQNLRRAPLRVFSLLISARVVGLLFIVFGLGSLYVSSRIAFVRSDVLNVSDPRFFEILDPPGFAKQDARAEGLSRCRAMLPAALWRKRTDLQKIIFLCHWVRVQQPNGSSWIPRESTLWERIVGPVDQPLGIVSEMRAGAPANCRAFSYALVGAALGAGIPARVIIVMESFFKTRQPSHVMAELWAQELNRWVLVDAMLDDIYFADGVPASAGQIYAAIQNGDLHKVSVLRSGIQMPYPKPDDLRRQFRNLFISLTNAVFDGYQVSFFSSKRIRFAHLTTAQNVDFPNRLTKSLFLSCLLFLIAGFFTLSRSVAMQILEPEPGWCG